MENRHCSPEVDASLWHCRQWKKIKIMCLIESGMYWNSIAGTHHHVQSFA